MSLAQPAWLLLVLPAAAAAWLSARGGGPPPALAHPAAGRPGLRAGRRAALARALPPSLQAAALAACAAALAGPRLVGPAAAPPESGVDIVLAVDTSLSMAALDLKPDRLEVAREAAKRFVRGRVSDRIGVVAFGGAPLMSCPLTLDYEAVLERLDSLRVGMTGAEGTALGDGLASALRRLKDSPAKSKVVVLLTDGRGNTGAVDAATAAKAAAALGVKVYTLGTAGRGETVVPVDDPRFGRTLQRLQDDLDEPGLAEIARLTGGKSWRAETPRAVRDAYDEIDRLEKSETRRPPLSTLEERHRGFLLAAALLLLAEAALSAGPLLRWP